MNCRSRGTLLLNVITNYINMKTNTHLKGYFCQLQRNFAIIVFTSLIVMATADRSYAQSKLVGRSENYGNTLNLGLGIGYFHYLDYSVPFFSFNYEFNVAPEFTLAPFVGIASYRSENYYDYGGYHYYYHETVVPMGVKGTYYFDRILGAGPRWDFYLAASLGFIYDRVVWDDGYYGNKGISRSASPLYLDGHIGAEYHLSRRVGLFLDLSTGVSTLGLAVHRR
jgi:hypothetical protein